MVKTIYLDSHFKYIVFFCVRKANARLIRSKRVEPEKQFQMILHRYAIIHTGISLQKGGTFIRGCRLLYFI